MTLLLDTSILIPLERHDRATEEALRKLALPLTSPPQISFMTLTEFLEGMERRPLSMRAGLKEFIWQFPVIHTTNATALLTATLKCKYEKLGKKKSIADLFIAAQAIEHNLTLVTKDTDFKDMDELKKVIL